MSIKVEKISNGYLVTDSWDTIAAYPTLEEVLNHILSHFEGKSKTFKGDLYGRVFIDTVEPSGKKEAI